MYPRYYSADSYLEPKSVSYCRSSLRFPDICLFYDLSNFEDMVDRYCNIRTIDFTLVDNACCYLYQLTNGHAGIKGGVRALFPVTGTGL